MRSGWQRGSEFDVAPVFGLGITYRRKLLHVGFPEPGIALVFGLMFEYRGTDHRERIMCPHL